MQGFDTGTAHQVPFYSKATLTVKCISYRIPTLFLSVHTPTDYFLLLLLFFEHCYTF